MGPTSMEMKEWYIFLFFFSIACRYDVSPWHNRNFCFQCSEFPKFESLRTPTAAAMRLYLYFCTVWICALFAIFAPTWPIDINRWSSITREIDMNWWTIVYISVRASRLTGGGSISSIRSIAIVFLRLSSATTESHRLSSIVVRHHRLSSVLFGLSWAIFDRHRLSSVAIKCHRLP